MEYRNRTVFLKTGKITISLRIIAIPISYLYENQNSPNVLHMPSTTLHSKEMLKLATVNYD